jgi:hypothetical protein
MHRSGTSLVARLLAASGVYGGPADELVAPAPDNVEGFGENIRFLRFNDAILARLGGFWDRPPAMPPGWASSPRLSRLRRDAVSLLARYRGRDPWFWKDPRNSLTLPFWRGMMPDLRVVVCVRDPVEVVASLARRRELPVEAAWALWLAYNCQALADAPAERRVVTHVAAYLHDAPAELNRVATALGLSLSAEAVARACAIVVPQLKARGERAPEMPAAVAELYHELCREAGPVSRGALTSRGARCAVARAAAAGHGTPGAEPEPRLDLLGAVRAVDRVWRQEGVRALVGVVTLRVRRGAARAREAFRGARSRGGVAVSRRGDPGASSAPGRPGGPDNSAGSAGRPATVVSRWPWRVTVSVGAGPPPSTDPRLRSAGDSRSPAAPGASSSGTRTAGS